MRSFWGEYPWRKMCRNLKHVLVISLFVACLTADESTWSYAGPGMLSDDNEVAEGDSNAMDSIASVNTETAHLMPPNADRNSDGLFEYDIQLHAASHEVVFGRDPNRFYGASSNFNILWPGGVVYYTLSDSIEKEEDRRTWIAIQGAFDEYKKKTCIRFVERTNQRSYVEFFKGNGCWSMIGRTGGKQQVSIGFRCEEVGVVVHELAHLLGFWHEQSRPDRDSYVEIINSNIKTGEEKQFEKYDNGRIDSMQSPYDYTSVMHYGRTAFSKDPTRPTIKVLDSNFKGKIGQRLGLSVEDVKQMNQLYKCSSSSIVPVDGQWSSWSGWSSCSQKCGGGSQQRMRSCSSPAPQSGGTSCAGESKEHQSCNQQTCTLSISCTFDESFCSWSSSNSAEFQWQRSNVATGNDNTGPTEDRSGDGYYIYAPLSIQAKDDRAVLETPLLKESQIPLCLVFYYHMYGTDMGHLNIYIETSSKSKVWRLVGDQGNVWRNGTVSVPAYTGNFKLVIESVVGRVSRSNVAMDDFRLIRGPCTTTPNNANPLTVVTTTTQKPQVKPKESSVLDCDFEEMAKCKWMNSRSQDTMDWKITAGRTETLETGPPSGSTRFAFIEGSSPAIPGDIAWLLSPAFPVELGGKCFQFDYSMYGASMGELSVLFYSRTDGQLKRAWSLSGNQGAEWKTGTLTLPRDDPNILIIIEAVRGKDYASDIAIDNILVKDTACEVYPAKAAILTLTDGPKTTATTTPPPPAPQDGMIQIEVISEGCGDPIVRKRTIEHSNAASSRKRRSIGDWVEKLSNAFKTVKKAGKKVLKELKKDDDIYTGLIKSLGKHLSKKLMEIAQNNATPLGVGNEAVFENNCALARSSIKVNGVEYSTNKPGHNVVAINGRTGNYIASKHYDTKNNFIAGVGVDNDLLRLPDDSIVIVATQDSVVNQFLGQSVLKELGAIPPYLPSSQGSWALIGYKGKRSVDWVRQVSNIRGRGPSVISAKIPFIKDDTTDTGPDVPANTLLTISLIKEEAVFNGRSYMPLSLAWSNKLNFGAPAYTVSTWLRTVKGGPLISKVPSSLTGYEDTIKTVYVENLKVHVKLSSGPGFSIDQNVADGAWHHFALTVQKSSSGNSRLIIYINKQRRYSGTFPTTVDTPGSLVSIGRTVDGYPNNEFFIGSLKNMLYKNFAVEEDDLGSLQ